MSTLLCMLGWGLVWGVSGVLAVSCIALGCTWAAIPVFYISFVLISLSFFKLGSKSDK